MINRFRQISEQTSTSFNRIKLLKPTTEPTYINISNLESMAEAQKPMEYYIIELTDYTDAFSCADKHIRNHVELQKQHFFTDLETATERLDELTIYEEAEILTVILDTNGNITSIESEQY